MQLQSFTDMFPLFQSQPLKEGQGDVRFYFFAGMAVASWKRLHGAQIEPFLCQPTATPSETTVRALWSL